MNNYKIGFIGIGNMGFAMLQAVINSNIVPINDIFVYEISTDNLKKAEQFNVNVCSDISECIQKSDMIFLGFKPYNVDDILPKITDDLQNKAVISPIAGYKYSDFAKYLHNSTRLLTVLPNLPLSVAKGVIGYTKSETNLSSSEIQFFEQLFTNSAILTPIKEEKLGVLSAISGSAPAFTALYIDSLAKAATKNGIDPEIAALLSTQTVLGTSQYITESGKTPEEVQKQVCSPNGTSIEGVKSLQTDDFAKIVDNAVSKTISRWDELS